MTLEPLLQASPAIQLHAAAALAAFAIGGVVLFRRKGGRVHMLFGRIWVLLMLVVVFSSFFIHTINVWGVWSPIHLLSVGTFVALVYGLGAIRRRNVKLHMRMMKSTYLGALVIAGFFTFLPGRIMHEVLFSGSSATELALLAAGSADPVWSSRALTRRGADWTGVHKKAVPVKGVTVKRGAEWLKPGAIARVRHLKGEDILRHATLRDLVE